MLALRMLGKKLAAIFSIHLIFMLHPAQSLSFAIPPKPKNTSMKNEENYFLGKVDLSQKWHDLVENGHVSVETTISDGEEKIEVRYGVKLDGEGSSQNYVDFVEQIASSNPYSKECERLREMNITLRESRGRPIVRSLHDFVAQLQLVRTIRPPPSAGFVPEMTSATPPQYLAETDSFVMEGSLSLFERPLVGSIDNCDTYTAWDIYHNVSPLDVRGHFLLIPSLANQRENWREQRLISRDCMDLCHLTQRMSSNLVIVYNSVGAGASQNHIHCHVFPSPTLALMSSNKNNQYAVLKAKPLSPMEKLGKQTSCCLLDFPCCCIRLESSDMSEIGLALSTIIQSLKESWNDVPHNVALFRLDEHKIRVFVFCRSRQQSPVILPHSRLGGIEMLGVFHVKTAQDLDELATPTANFQNPMEQSLKDVSLEPKSDVWESMYKVLAETFAANSKL